MLLNTDDEGCSPAVNGKRVSVIGYFDEFRKGYHDIYSHIAETRDELSAFIRERSGSIPIRQLIRNTQYYHDTMLKLYHRNALSSPEKQEQTNELLSKIMRNNVRSDFIGAVESELQQIKRGDIPYIYTYANSSDLYSDGEIVAKNVFENTAAGHALRIIAAMSEADEAFDLGLLESAVMQCPKPVPEDEREELIKPVRTSEPLTREQALTEAKDMFDRVFALSPPSPNDKLFWGYVNESDFAYRFCEAGLTNDLGGIALFTSAYAFVSEDEQARKLADKAVNEFVIELDRMYCYLESKGFLQESAPYLGESEGVGGMLNALALIRRYTGRKDIEDLQKKTMFALGKYDLSKYGAPDRLIGMSGLLSVLCRFEEYRDASLIRSAADSLLAMKTLEHKGRLLWKPLPNANRPISGGGHGLAGIAEALCAAAKLLGDNKYSEAAADALTFEVETYTGKFGTWADLRTIPPVGYMHGYCS